MPNGSDPPPRGNFGAVPLRLARPHGDDGEFAGLPNGETGVEPDGSALSPVATAVGEPPAGMLVAVDVGPACGGFVHDVVAGSGAEGGAWFSAT